MRVLTTMTTSRRRARKGASSSGLVSRASVKRMISERLESKTTSFSTSSATTTGGAIGYVSTVAQDDTIFGRTGDIIRPVCLRMRYNFHDTANLNYARIIVFRDSMCQAASPNVTDVLATAQYNSSYNFRNVYQQRRFTILHDHTFGMTPSGFNAQFYEKVIRLKGVINYVGTGSTVASAGKNSLFLMTISGVAGAGCDVSTRLEFKDG